MDTPTTEKLALQAEVRQLRERIAKLENERLTAQEDNRRATLERRVTEPTAALRESEERFRSVLEDSRDVIYRLNIQTGRFEYISPRAETVVGLPREDLMAQDSEAALAMIHPDDRPAMRAAIERLHETGSAEAEYRQLTKNGEYRWLSNAMSLTTGESGQPLFRNGNIRDITERRRADEALRESDRRFRSLFENSTDAVFLSAIDGRIFAANPAACAMLGMSEREICEKGRAGVIAPEDPRVGSAVETRVSERRVHAELTFVRKDGSRFEGDVTSMALDEAGDAFVVVRDITERKRAEEALRESEERFRAMADSCPTPIWVTDAAGGNRFVNRKYREFFGVTIDQVEGTKWQPLVHPEDAPGYTAAVARAVQDRAPCRAEARVRRADGEWRRMASYCEPRRSPGGEFLGMGGMSSDVTEHRQAEAGAARERDAIAHTERQPAGGSDLPVPPRCRWQTAHRLHQRRH